MYAHRESQEQKGRDTAYSLLTQLYLSQINVAVLIWETIYKMFVLSVAIVIILLQTVVNAKVSTVIPNKIIPINEQIKTAYAMHLLRLRQSCCYRLSKIH